MSIQNPTEGYERCLRCGCLRPIAKLAEGICVDGWKECKAKSNGGGYRPQDKP